MIADEYLGVTDAKRLLPRRIVALQAGTVDRVIIVKHNRPVAVMVSVERYAALTEEVEG